ncbi:BamA/TamA family outer membrane protein [Longimicrobium sp.]|uniref:BamA/TamA family outer membrane protein n=1 Tax=Longimicrobium sp. TaxID=2029185 RepID=UPI003B3BBC71
MARTLRVFLLLAAMAGALAPAARAQDSVTVVVGPEYRAGGVQRWLWGQNWRHLWTRTVRVEVLDPDTFAGGLTPLRAGGDFASNTLHMLGADGRRYVFRSINKNVSKGLGPEFEGTLVEWVVQDQVSASHPGSPRLAAPLLEAAGILHAAPRMVVMRDRASLGQCRERFANLVGHIEERADENDPEDPADEADTDAGGDEPGQTGGEEEAAEADPLDESCGVPTREGQMDGPAFAGAVKVKGTEEFLDDLEDSPINRLNSREYLAARLMDIYMGDWDRHEDQWRWARFDRGDLRVWRPVPRDRDNAFVNHEGLLLAIGRAAFIRNVRFDREFPSLTGLTVQAEPLDRRLLSDLPRTAWDSVVVQLRARLTDAAIERAVGALPPEYQQGERVRLVEILRARREALPGQAELFYKRLSQNVDVYATDVDEVAVIDRHADGSVEVTVTGAGDNERRFVTYQRRFLPEETDDVRLYLQGGDDRAVVRGTGHGVGIRVIGGGGDDVMEDSSRSSGVAFYDHRGENRFVRGPVTRVDQREWEAPVDSSAITGHRTYREWGSSSSLFRPFVDWKRGAGPVIGGGPQQTSYSFRRAPHAWEAHARVGWAPTENRFLVSAAGDLHPENARHWYSLDSYASNLENVRFFGFGNNTDKDVPRELRDSWLRQVRVEPSLHFPVGRRGTIELGPVLQWTDPELESGSPLDVERPIGFDTFGQLGFRTELELDGRDVPSFPRRGWRLETGGSAYPAVLDADGAFGEAHVMAATYLSLGAGPVVALRAGGKRVWGDFPFFESAFLGGGSTLRGYTGQRFAGDMMAFGGAELRMPLVRLNLLARGVFGVMGLMDAGRVWYDGESDGELHTGIGGGAFYHVAGQTVTVTVASGERTSLNFGFGMPF